MRATPPRAWWWTDPARNLTPQTTTLRNALPDSESRAPEPKAPNDVLGFGFGVVELDLRCWVLDFGVLWFRSLVWGLGPGPLYKQPSKLVLLDLQGLGSVCA